MDDLYSAVRNLHIAAVLASGIMFVLRATAFNLVGARWPLRRPVRIAAYFVDTLLLAAAVTLVAITGQYPFVHAWLTVKVLMLIVYIALGWFALRAGQRRWRIGFTLAAVASYLFIISIARSHHPLGFIALGRIW